MEKIKIGTERLFLRSPNINVCFRIVVEGFFDSEKISVMMKNVCERHPLLKCSIEIDNEHNAWFIENRNQFEIEHYKYEEMSDWKNWYKKIDDNSFDFLHGPLVKMCVIDGGGQTEIIILGHHIIGDGIGYFNLAKDILLALDNKLETTPQIPPVNSKFIKGGKLGFLPKLYAKKLNKSWRKSPVYFSEEDYFTFFQDYRNRFIPQIYMDSINESDLQKLIELCKLNKLTVNELITSAFAVAFSSDKELRVGVAVNIRNELITKPYYCMGNYVSGISATVNCISENDFMSNVKSITKILRSKLTDVKTKHAIVNFLREFDNDLLESVMFASYGNYDLPISKNIGARIAEGVERKGLGMSNLGRHCLKNFDNFYLIDLQFIGPAFPANILSVSIITVNNKLNIVLRYNKAEIKTDTVIRIYKKTIDLLFDKSKGNGI